MGVKAAVVSAGTPIAAPPPRHLAHDAGARLTDRYGGVGGVESSRLVQLARDARECGVQVAAERRDHGDDRPGNAGRQQAVFDGGRTLFVSGKIPNEIAHGISPSIVGVAVPSARRDAPKVRAVGRKTYPL